MPVGVLEGLGELVLRQAGDLLEHLARGVGVDLLVGADPQDVAATEHLEEVELDVAQVALVVAHGRVLPMQVSACLPVCYPRVTIAEVQRDVVRGILAAPSIVPVRCAARSSRGTPTSHRAATLELLFDLVFVVAIASNAAQLHHGPVRRTTRPSSATPSPGSPSGGPG